MAKVFADDISLCTTEEPLIVYRRFAIVDSLGNNNRKLDRDETGTMLLTLRANAGAVANLSGEIQSLAPDLRILQGSSSFGNLNTGDSATGVFVVHASGSAPIEDPLWCRLALSGTSFTETLMVPVIVGDSVNEPLGPDAYGYMAFDNEDITYSERPTYEWVEIRGSGTRLILGDDATQTIDLPPEFGPIYYYGQRTTRLSVCSNGWVAPDTSTRVDFNNIRLPDAYAPQRIIALNWDNLDPTAYGWIGYYHDAANHRFIVTYDSVPYFPQYVAWEKFQIVILDTTLAGPTGDNILIVQHATSRNVGSVGAGIQNHERNSGLSYVQNLGYPRQSAPIAPGRAIKYLAHGSTGISEPAPRPTRDETTDRQLEILSLAPNPARTRIRVSCFMSAPGELTLQLFDITGARKAGWTRTCASAGRHDVLIDCRQLVPGVYLLQLKTDKGWRTKKVVVEP